MRLFNRNKKSKNFKYLDKLIHSGSKEIILDYDIILDDTFLSREYKDLQLVYELAFESDIILETNRFTKMYKKLEPKFNLRGIQLDVDNLVIDGNGHTIDAKGKTQIFNCTGKNITIKNITLKNGLLGAISNSGELTIIESNFLKNSDAENGGAIKNNGILTISESALTENSAGHGGAIYNAGKLTITESTLTNNSASTGGSISNVGKLRVISSTFTGNTATWRGAIDNSDAGELTITESTFTNNTAELKGGAITSSGHKVTIEKSRFNQNFAQVGSAIISSGDEVTIEKSIFSQNSAQSGGDVININKGNFKLINCKFFDNKSSNSIITNHDLLNDYNSVFIGNQTEKIIVNEGDSSKYSNIGGKFKDNEIYESLIFNTGKSVTIKRSIFENNLSNISSQNIFNGSNLILIKPKIKDEGKTILNKGHILIKNSSKDLIDKINDKGTVETNAPPKEEKYDFGGLDKKIHQNTVKKIILDHDICLENYEHDFYEGGIELDIDNFIIDGNGHTIDGVHKSRIFTITGNNITLKNIIFKNGYSHIYYDNSPNNNGGAIKTNRYANLNIENCKFINNVSEGLGGALYATGDLSITESAFNENHATTGGALYATKDLSITESAFNENHATTGGAIFNCRDLTLIESTFLRNKANNGGAIKNNGTLTISESTLNENHASNGGGAIKNNGTLTISESTLNENHASDGGGAIENNGTLTISESTLNENHAPHGRAIFNYGSFNIFKSSVNNGSRDIYTYNNQYKVNVNNTIELYEEFSKTLWKIENQ